MEYMLHIKYLSETAQFWILCRHSLSLLVTASSVFFRQKCQEMYTVFMTKRVYPLKVLLVAAAALSAAAVVGVAVAVMARVAVVVLVVVEAVVG